MVNQPTITVNDFAVIGVTPDGRRSFLGAFSEDMAARLRNLLNGEIGDEFAEILVVEADDQGEVVLEEPELELQRQLDEDIEFLNSAGVHIATNGNDVTMSDATVHAMAAMIRCVKRPQS